MKRKMILDCFVATLLAMTVIGVLADESATPTADNITEVRSSDMTKRAWRKSVVTVDEEGNLGGDQGVVASAVEFNALDTVADEAITISEASQASLTNSLQYLYSNTNNMATSGLGIALAFKPALEDPSPHGFVVKTETETLNGVVVDRQWVYYNVELSLAPNRLVVYERNDGTIEHVKCKWVSWTNSGTTITVAGETYSGVHECTVERPTWAVGQSCLELPNETWGGAEGINFGDLLLLQEDGNPYYTGYVTNTVEGLVAYFDNGFLKELIQLTGEEQQ